MEQLIRGEAIEKIIDDNIVLKHIETNENSLWSFLLMGGYLKPTDERMSHTTGRMHYTLMIPNMEVRTAYIQIIENYFSTKIENKKLAIVFNGKDVTVKKGE